ncbi:UNVERIFIED_CONTAM: hypothetical protein K2H54_037423 [Gekko kuhli]
MCHPPYTLPGGKEGFQSGTEPEVNDTLPLPMDVPSWLTALQKPFSSPFDSRTERGREEALSLSRGAPNMDGRAAAAAGPGQAAMEGGGGPGPGRRPTRLVSGAAGPVASAAAAAAGGTMASVAGSRQPSMETLDRVLAQENFQVELYLV